MERDNRRIRGQVFRGVVAPASLKVLRRLREPSGAHSGFPGRCCPGLIEGITCRRCGRLLGDWFSGALLPRPH